MSMKDEWEEPARWSEQMAQAWREVRAEEKEPSHEVKGEAPRGMNEPLPLVTEFYKLELAAKYLAKAGASYDLMCQVILEAWNEANKGLVE